MDMQKCKKIFNRSKFFYSGGGAATLGWPATAPELRDESEKMTGILERSESFSL